MVVLKSLWFFVSIFVGMCLTEIVEVERGGMTLGARMPSCCVSLSEEPLSVLGRLRSRFAAQNDVSRAQASAEICVLEEKG